MQVLLANLRHFSQRVGLRSAYAGIGLITCFAIWIHSYTTGLAAAAVLFPILMVFVLPVSQIVATMQVEVLSRPFAFCLPGHQIALRRLVFVAGLAVSLGALFMFPLGRVPSGQLIPALCSTFCASLAVYFVGIGLVYIFALPGIAVAMVGCFIGFVGYFWGLDRAVAEIIIHSPVPVIVAGIVSAATMWLCLGHRPWFLSFRRARRGWSPGRWDRVACERSPIEKFILGRMRDSEHAGAAKHIWATLYVSLLPRSPACRRIGGAAVLALIFAFVGWYSLPTGLMLIYFAAMSAAESIPDTHLPIYSKFLTNGGRRERYVSTIVLLMVLGGVMTFTVTLTFLLMNLFSPPPLPEWLAFLHIKGEPAMDLRLMLLSMTILPLASVLLALLREKRLPAQIAYAILAPPLFFLFLGVLEHETMTIPLSVIAVATLSSWLICALGIHRITMRSDLVRQ